jgi:hypothetical protein
MKGSISRFALALGLSCALLSGAAVAQLNVPIVRTIPLIGDPPIGVIGKLPILSELDASLGLVDLLGAKALPDIEILLTLERQLDIGRINSLLVLPGLDDLSLSGDGLGLEALTGLLVTP